jgi:hypothetical protein
VSKHSVLHGDSVEYIYNRPRGHKISQVHDYKQDKKQATNAPAGSCRILIQPPMQASATREGIQKGRQKNAHNKPLEYLCLSKKTAIFSSGE